MGQRQCFRLLAVLTAVFVCAGCGRRGPQPGAVQDEALAAGRNADSFPAADEDYFKDMDGGTALTANEIKGRNNWIVWSGGTDRFWDHLVGKSFGAVDFLKILSSHPEVKHLSRDTRWRHLGLVNEPCFDKAKEPHADRFGLWLDTRRKDCPPDPFENEQKYPGVAIGARGKNIPVGSYYGYASGIVGLRLFPNPDFDEAAQKKWDPKRFYTDPSYYNDKNLIRPYRVGMSCGFCHVGPSPVRPPDDPENPNGKTSTRTPARNIFGSTGFSSGRRTKPTSFISYCTRPCRAPWILRLSRPITSITRAR